MTDIREKVWHGSIPCIITLYTNDSNQMVRKYEFYKIVPRNSYFPLFFDEILFFFKPHLLVPEWSSRPEWWLEVEGVPVRWNWPIGVLYDAMSGVDPEAAEVKSSEPWRLTLRYRNYPDDYLLPLAGKTLETHWTNQVKESCYVQHGTAKPVMILSKADSSTLWDSVGTHDFKRFWTVFNKITPTSIASMKSIPVRFYITTSDKVIDLPVSPINSHTGKQNTLGDALHKLLPDLFKSSMDYNLAKPVLHGIVIPPDTPLAELFYEALYIDGFLHVAIIPVST